MIQSDSVLAIVPARGGSKGASRKNLRPLGGRPLVAWTIAAARSSKYIDRLILSSEDAEIIQTAKDWGCDVPFVRPQELAADDTPGIAPVLHALRALPGFGLVVLLQPTSPFRSTQDVDACIEACALGAAPACVSVTESEHSPYWTYKLDADRRLKPIISEVGLPSRRQDLPSTYVLNGAVYVARTDWLLRIGEFITEETTGYVMPALRSLDIDTELDLRIAEFMFKEIENGTSQNSR